jgi:hypothetical protein
VSLEEKRAWTDGLLALVFPAIYVAVVLGRAGSPIEETAYIRPMITTIVAAIVVNMVIHIVTVVGWHRESQLADERDRHFDRIGYTVGFLVMSVCTLVPLGLAMAEADPFWIANAIYLSFCVAAVSAAGVKIVAYRRGL